MEPIGRRFLVGFFSFVILFSGFSSVSAAAPPASKWPKKLLEQTPISFLSLSLPLFLMFVWLCLQKLWVGLFQAHCLGWWNGYGHSKPPPKLVILDPTCSFSSFGSFWFWILRNVVWLLVCFSAITGRSMMKFESGYTVETVFDGSKLGVEPYSVEVLPNGELLILDSANSNLYRISSSLSLRKWFQCSMRIQQKRKTHKKGEKNDDT